MWDEKYKPSGWSEVDFAKYVAGMNIKTLRPYIKDNPSERIPIKNGKVSKKELQQFSKRLVKEISDGDLKYPLVRKDIMSRMDTEFGTKGRQAENLFYQVKNQVAGMLSKPEERKRKAKSEPWLG